MNSCHICELLKDRYIKTPVFIGGKHTQSYDPISRDMSNSKKKRRPKVAPRYTRNRDEDAGKYVDENRVVTSQQVKLVRGIFTRTTCRCFVLKSFSEANIHKSLKFGIWSTTTLHSALLNQVYNSDTNANLSVLLFFRYSHLQCFV